MVFLTLVLIAITSYICDYKIPAIVLLFFLLTSGFNLIPEEMMDIGFISKGADYAFFILIGIIITDSFFLKNYLRPDKLVIWLMVLGGFLLVCIVNSKFVLGLSWGEVIRTSRYQYFWLAYFVFRNMEREPLEKILKILCNITVVLSFLFLLQIVLSTSILNKSMVISTQLFGMKIPRFYNQPDMLHFFTFMAIYNNPNKGKWKIITKIILVLALVGAFHRSLIGMFVLTMLIGYTLKLPRLRRIMVLSSLAFVLAGIIAIAGTSFVRSKTYVDLQNISSGNFADVSEIDPDVFRKSTFTFRLALLFERNQYLLEHPKSMFIGAGLLAEDSKQVNQMFDFQIGLADIVTNQTMQLDSPDISYSSLLLRMGYLGTLLYLSLFIYLMVFFYKHKENKYGLFSFLFLVLSMGTSFFSANLLMPITYMLPLMSYTIIQKEKHDTTS